MYMDPEFTVCFCCGNKSRDWLGSYSCDQLLQAVCAECSAKGVKADDAPDAARKKLKLYNDQKKK